jgi:hypothetical protein
MGLYSQTIHQLMYQLNVLIFKVYQVFFSISLIQIALQLYHSKIIDLDF